MVYLIHFERPFGHARHYIGYCGDGNLLYRFNHHLHGKGSRLMAAVAKAGIKCLVVRTWSGADRNFERKLKQRRQSRTLCPICVTKAEVSNLWNSTPYIPAAPVVKSMERNVESTPNPPYVYSGVEGE